MQAPNIEIDVAMLSQLEPMNRLVFIAQHQLMAQNETNKLLASVGTLIEDLNQELKIMRRGM